MACRKMTFRETSNNEPENMGWTLVGFGHKYIYMAKIKVGGT